MTMSFEENLHRIQERIHSACERAGRDPSSVLLLPISKGQPAEVIIEAAESGCTVFGEPRCGCRADGSQRIGQVTGRQPMRCSGAR